MSLLKRAIPALERACTQYSRTIHTTPGTMARVPIRTRARTPGPGMVVKDIDPEACLPPLTLLNSAHKSGALEISPSDAQDLLRQYLKLSLQAAPGSGWENLLCKDYNTTPKTIHLLGQILNRCPTNAQRSLSRRVMQTASLLGENSATFSIIESGLRKGKIGLQEHEAPLKSLGLLAKGGNPQAMVLMGKVMYFIDREKEAFDWYLKATEHGTDFEGAGEAFVQVGRLRRARGDEKGAEEAFRKAALEIDDPMGYFYLSKFQADESPEEKVYLLKAASSGVAEAMHNLGSLETDRLEKLGKGPMSSEMGEKKASLEQYKTAREWFEVAAAQGFGLSMLNLASIHRTCGDAETGEKWLKLAEESPDCKEQANRVREQWGNEGRLRLEDE